MPPEPPPRQTLRETFQELLNLALTRGSATHEDSGLGPGTRAAIDAVAYDHPNAEADCIRAAYDAFHQEHGSG
jgi:hypothetical protein